MKIHKHSLIYAVAAMCILGATVTQAQQPKAAPAASAATNVTVPRLVAFGGAIRDSAGKPQSGLVGLTFSLYEQQEGGTALWVEQQNVQLDEHGQYSVFLGAADPEGLPVDLFASGKARWLGVQPQTAGETERPRSLLVAMPYALKAVDADTLGGRPASAYLMAKTQSGHPGSAGAGNNLDPTAITQITAGTDLIGGGTSGNITLGLDLSKTDARYAKLYEGNQFLGLQLFYGHGGWTMIGDMGCNTNSSGISFGDPGLCTNYALLGFNGDTMLNAPKDHAIHFRINNWADAVTIDQNKVSIPWILDAGTVNAGTMSTKVLMANDPADDFGQAISGSVSGSQALAVAGFAGGSGSAAIFGSASAGAKAGKFFGDVSITGILSAGTKQFRIDHPLDPANKYLQHTSIESSEMSNIYSGNAKLDGRGEAVVTLPDWFEALNTDFRYALTCVGGFAQVFVADEISGNRFRIAGGTSGLKVSWQVTGVRQDAFAKANPTVVEADKPASERGFYLHPELFGATADRAIDAVRPNVHHDPSTKQ